MRKTTMLLATVGAMVLLVTGIALAATTINCKGGTCVGTNNEDRMRGTGGIDRMSGRGGNDVMSGSYNADVMYGGEGLDTINGDYGADKISGNAGNDDLSGGPVGDRIYGGPGTDVVEGNAGNDFINVAGDDVKDSVSCGIGDDTAVVDAADLGRQSFEDFVRLSSCEDVTVR